MEQLADPGKYEVMSGFEQEDLLKMLARLQEVLPDAPFENKRHEAKIFFGGKAPEGAEGFGSKN